MLTCWEGKTDSFVQKEKRTPQQNITQWSLAYTKLRKEQWALRPRALSFGFDFTFALLTIRPKYQGLQSALLAIYTIVVNVATRVHYFTECLTSQY